MACPSLSSTPGAPRQKKTHEPSRAWEISRALLAVFSFNIRAPGPWTFTDSKARGLRLTGLPLVGGPGWDRRRVDPVAWVPARSRAGARWGTAYPLGGRGFSGASGRSAPGAPPARRGSPFLPRNGEKEGRGRCPLDPQFYGPLAAARSFWRSCRIVPVMGLFRCPSSYPDLGTFFHKMLFQHIFYSKMRPKSVLEYRW